MPRVALEETLTMVPHRRSSIKGRTAWQHHSVGISERRISASICSGENSANGRILIAPPTQLIRISILPRMRRAVVMAACAPSADSRSASTAVPPCARASSSTMFERSTITTDPPSATARLATARPMPCAAPVTTSLFLSNRPAKVMRLRPRSAGTSRNGSLRARCPSRTGTRERLRPWVAVRTGRCRNLLRSDGRR